MNATLYGVYEKILELSGHEMNFEKMNAGEISTAVEGVFEMLSIDRGILTFDSGLDGKKLTPTTGLSFVAFVVFVRRRRFEDRQ